MRDGRSPMPGIDPMKNVKCKTKMMREVFRPPNLGSVSNQANTRRQRTLRACPLTVRRPRATGSWAPGPSRSPQQATKAVGSGSAAHSEAVDELRSG